MFKFKDVFDVCILFIKVMINATKNIRGNFIRMATF